MLYEILIDDALMLNVAVSSESAAAGGDALLYRYVVKEVGQVSTSTVDACRVGSVACGHLNCICKLYCLQVCISYYRGYVLVHFLVAYGDQMLLH